MTKSKFARTALISAVATLAFSGAAFADSANISTTGPSSSNTVTTDVSNNVNITNQDNVTVTNSNTQTAQTGDATVSYNTTAGAAMSGAASNANTVTTTIGTSSSTAPCSCSVAMGGGSSNPSSPAAGSTTIGGSKGVGGGSGSVGTLPETGASVPVDVSALRNLFNPVSQTTPLTAAVKANKTISTVGLALAAVLSLLGAIGTAVYSTKRTLRV